MSNALPGRAGASHLSVWQDDDTVGADVVGEPDADATTAIVAHGLLGNLAVVRGVSRLLIGDSAVPDQERARLFEVLDSQVELMHGVLTDLVRGLPAQALAALDELRR